MKKIFLLPSLLFFGCTTPNMPGEEESDFDDSATVTIENEDTGVVVNSDAGVGDSSRKWQVSLESCSVSLVIHFVEARATLVELKNYNDRSVIVEIFNTTTNGVMLSNCLWPENSIFGGEDEEEVSFDVNDVLKLNVKLGNGDWASTTCIDEFDKYLDLFDECNTSDLSFIPPF